VQPWPNLGAEVFVGVVAHRDHQITVLYDVPDVRGAGRVELEAVPVGHLDRARMDPGGGLGAGRGDRAADPVAPQRGGQLRPRRVVRADEQHPLGPFQGGRGETREHLGLESQVIESIIIER
jgi:hypothetical protein